MTRVLVPRFEPEVIEAAARKHYRGDPEKVATTSVPELMYRGVAITSRYGKADELETMAAMLDGISPDLWRYIDTLSCNSRIGNSYFVGLRRCNPSHGREIGAQLADFITAYKGGYNGIQLSHADDTILLDIGPDWSFAPDWSFDEGDGGA
jgi:hypothetical protein